MYKLIIQLHKAQIKFNLSPGDNLVGNDQTYPICIANKQVVANHCRVVLENDDIELVVQDGPVYMKCEDEWVSMPKDSTIVLNSKSDEFNVRLGSNILVKATFDMRTSSKENKPQVLYRFVESQILNNPIIDIFGDQTTDQPPNPANDLNVTPDFANPSHAASNERKSRVRKSKPLLLPGQTTLEQYNIKSINQTFQPSPKRKSKQKAEKSLQKEFSKKKSKSSQKFKQVVAYSGYVPSEDEINYLLDQKGLLMNTKSEFFDVLLMESPINLRTVKLLYALARNAPIVSRNWILDSMSKFTLLDMGKYTAKFHKEFRAQYSFDYKRFQERFQECQEAKRLPLQGLKIHVPRELPFHIDSASVQILIEELGGEVDEEGELVLIPKDFEHLPGENRRQFHIESLFQSILQYKSCFT